MVVPSHNGRGIARPTLRNSTNGKEKNKSRLLRCTMEGLLVIFLLVVAAMLVLNFVTVVQHRSSSSTSSTSTASTPRIRQSSSIGGKKQQQQQQQQQQNYHVVFSTSCSYQHDWQSYLFFFHAMLHEQPGDVTRIVSGCSDEDEVTMRRLHEEQYSIMNPNFLIHFTPEFGRQLADKGFNFQQTKYWNKPFGLRHWLHNRFGYTWTEDGSGLSTEYDDDIIILVDPDMLMQRPFLNDLSGFPDDLWTKYYQQRPELLLKRVEHGHPVAQDYSFGAQWLTSVQHNLTYVVGPDSPVHQVTMDEAHSVYSAGPPYWFTAKDGFQIAYHWSEFLPRIFELKPVFMAEMYGYCMAAAHLGLRHQMARGFMVSNVDMHDGEGWSFLDKADGTTCDVQQFQEVVPHVIHFCQRYAIGEYFLNKYLFPTEVLTCDFPLLELPPHDIVSYTNYSHFGDGSLVVWEGRKANRVYRHAFMICSLMPALNKAATFYKDHHCPSGANYKTVWNHHRDKLEKDAKKEFKKI